MSRYAAFTRVARDQKSLDLAHWKTSVEGGGSIILEDGDFIVSTSGTLKPDSNVELYLGEGSWLEVRDGLTPNVQLTLPDDYVEALDRGPISPERSRRLYWSSPTPPSGLDDPTQNPSGEGDLTLYVPEILEPSYREKGFSGRGTPSRRYLDIWEEYEPSTASAATAQGAAGRDAVERPAHYSWLGQSLAALGLSDAANVESWDLLDAAFPQDPLLWNCGKYLLRQGRKGGEEKRLEDLRKARQYLDRRIAQLTESEVSD